MPVDEGTPKPDSGEERREPPAQRKLPSLMAKFAEAEARLLRLEEERHADADLIGKLLGEVAERKGKLDAAIERAERAEVSLTDTTTRIAELHGELELMDSQYAEAIVAIESANEQQASAERELQNARAELDSANSRCQKSVEEVAALRATIEGERAARKETSRAFEDARVQMESLRETAGFTASADLVESLRRSSKGSIDLTSAVVKAATIVPREEVPEVELAWMLEAIGGALDDACGSMRTVAHRLVATRTIFDLVRFSGKSDPGGDDVLTALRGTLHEVTHAEERVGRAHAAIARASAILSSPPPHKGGRLALRRVITTVRAARDAIEPLVSAEPAEREPELIEETGSK